MTATPDVIPEQGIVYPDSDGQPMADNTLQFEWIVTIKEGLAALFRDRDDVFVAGDLLWYPVEGDNKTRVAPDALVAFGRPKGYRGFYQQWREGGIPPQVVFEVLSPGNTLREMARKFEFYDRYGVEEYYLYDPDTGDYNGWLRAHDRLEVIDEIDGWVSPRLGVRFELSAMGLRIYQPNGEPFLTYLELVEQREAERERAEAERERAEAERERAEAERERAEAAEQQVEQLRAKLLALGIDPDTLPA